MATMIRSSLTLIPADHVAHPDAIQAIEDADMVIIGSGSLFTSIVSNLLITGIAEALTNSPAFKLYVCNVAEEPTQTEGYSVLDHLKVVEHYGGASAVDAVIANNNIPEGPTPSGLDFIRIDKPWSDEILLIDADVIDDTDESRTDKHDQAKLSNIIAEAYRKYLGKRRWLPRRLNIDLRRTRNGRSYLDASSKNSNDT